MTTNISTRTDRASADPCDAIAKIDWCRQLWRHLASGLKLGRTKHRQIASLADCVARLHISGNAGPGKETVAMRGPARPNADPASPCRHLDALR